jgi:hypothetical protein
MQKHNLQTKKKMKRFFLFFFIKVLIKQQRENTNKHKTKKDKFWLKAQIAKNQSKGTQWQ